MSPTYYRSLVMIAFTPLLFAGSQMSITCGEEPHQVITFPASAIKAVCFSPDGKNLATSDQDGTIRVVSLETGKTVYQTSRNYKLFHDCFSVSFTSDSKHLVLSTSENEIAFIDIRSNRVSRRIAWKHGIIRSFVLSPDQRFIAVETATEPLNHSICLFDVEHDRLHSIVPSPVEANIFMTATVGRIAFSPDSTLLACSSWSNVVHIWDLKSGKEIRRLEGSTGGIQNLDFSPDGRLLVAGSAGRDDNGFPTGNQLFIWNVATGQRLYASENLMAPVNAVACSPDGRVLLTTNGRGRLIIFELAQCDELAELTACEVLCFSIDRDGQRFAAGTADGRILVGQLWSKDDPTPPIDNEQHWHNLGDRHLGKVYQAICCLARRPEIAVPFLRKTCLPAKPSSTRPEKPLSERRVRQLLKNLDDDDFVARETASWELAQAGIEAERLLEAEWSTTTSAEVRARLEKLFRAWRTWDITDTETLQLMRAILLLQAIGTPDAQRLLEEISLSQHKSHITNEASKAAALLARKRSD